MAESPVGIVTAEAPRAPTATPSSTKEVPTKNPPLTRAPETTVPASVEDQDHIADIRTELAKEGATVSEGVSVAKTAEPKMEAPENPSTQTKSETIQATENANKLKEIFNEPRFKEILAKIVAQETDGKTTLEEMQKKALAEFGQELAEQIAQETQEQKKSPLNPEQKAEIKKVLEKAFKDNPSEMRSITKEAAALTKAKAAEIQLQGEKNATQDQKEKAAELTKEITNRYGTLLEEAVDRIVASDRKKYLEKDEKGNLKEDPRNHPLIKLLSEAPTNPEILAMMQFESKKSLIKLILQWTMMLAMPTLRKGTEEAEKMAASTSGQQA